MDYLVKSLVIPEKAHANIKRLMILTANLRSSIREPYIIYVIARLTLPFSASLFAD